MDVFSLLKFWNLAGGRDTDTVRDSNSDDEESFFELVFTNCADESEFEDAKIGALLTRDNSLRSKFDMESKDQNNTSSKRFNKDVVKKYLNLMKPKLSKRSNDKSRLSEKSITPSSSPGSSVFSPKRGGGRGTVFRDVRKRLGKSRSASAILQTPVTKSDDSAIEQHDSITSAILHCKKSYNSPSQGCSVLSRSGSAPIE
ncbi:membrane-associated kinase regulator 5-like [Rutidosis leptorrhynchoides]|uniref:membrane-associated kinase regulator 5-like n=1 Tax=Rutidosis leptorrhynchoides TaxID=125765 RepID=UPI003A98D355